MKKLMSKPITWGAYTKLAIISMIIGMIITGLMWFDPFRKTKTFGEYLKSYFKEKEIKEA